MLRPKEICWDLPPNEDDDWDEDLDVDWDEDCWDDDYYEDELG